METNSFDDSENIGITKIKGDEYFKSTNDLNYYQNIIRNFEFYLIEGNVSETLNKEIDLIFENFYVKFSTFNFKTYENKKYLNICFENYCFSILIEKESGINFAKKLLNYLTESKIHFLSPNSADYTCLLQLNEKIKTKYDNFIFPHEKEQKMIEIEVNQFISSIKNEKSECILFKISRESLSAFIIRQYYFKCNFFRKQNFFANNENSFKEYSSNDFIYLRRLSSNTSLSYYKKGNFLVVLKYKSVFVKFEDFKRERELYCQINKLGHFVKCFGYIKNDENEVTSLVLEYMSRGTIQEYIKQKRLNQTNISIDKYKMSFQILEGLYLLHKNNIIHRDLKPDNIFINNNLDIFIGDFESSLNVTYDPTKTLTKDIGSIIYASPEMLNSVKYSNSTDIYSFGLILYFIFAENHPFSSKGDSDIIQIKNDLNYNFNDGQILDNFINSTYLKCISFDPGKRPSLDNIIDSFINQSYEQCKNDQYKFLIYLYINQNPMIEEKLLNIFSSLFNSKLDKDTLLESITEKYRNNEMLNISKALKNFLLKTENAKAIDILEYFLFNNQFSSNKIKESINFLENKARSKYFLALFFLGHLYFSGKYFEINIKKACQYLELSLNIDYLSISSENYSKVAQHILGVIYLNSQYTKPHKAIYYLTLSANQNYIEAQKALGKIYLSNSYVPRDVNKSIYYFTLCSDQGDSNAQFDLASIYIGDFYVPSDVDKSINYLILSAKNNNKKALFYLGMFYINGVFVQVDTEKGFDYLCRSANLNYPAAQNILGFLYYYGNIIEKDIKKAFHFLTLAAKQNFSDAQYSLGLLYLENNEYKDESKSINYLNLSAQQDNPYAIYYLAKIYYEGKILPKDVDKSIQYLNRIAGSDFPKADYLLGRIYYQENLDINKSIFYFKLSAYQNLTESQLSLGMIYYIGLQVPKNVNESIKYFEMAAKENENYSKALLGEIYYLNEDIPRDIIKAIAYFNDASVNSYAQNYLGVIYKNGNGVKYDITKSIEYFNRAIQNDQNRLAFINLARIYYFGINVDKNILTAIEILESAPKDTVDQIDFFLFFIYFFLDSKEKMNFYLNRLLSGFPQLAEKNIVLFTQYPKQMIIKFFRDEVFNCFKNYDFVKMHSVTCTDDFLLKLIMVINKKYIEFLSSRNKFHKNKHRILGKDFYIGLGSDLHYIINPVFSCILK